MKSRKEDVPGAGHFSLPLNELLPLCPQCHTSLEGLSAEEFMAANKNISSHPYIDFMYMPFAGMILFRSIVNSVFASFSACLQTVKVSASCCHGSMLEGFHVSSQSPPLLVSSSLC